VIQSKEHASVARDIFEPLDPDLRPARKTIVKGKKQVAHQDLGERPLMKFDTSQPSKVNHAAAALSFPQHGFHSLLC
jgi:hypothetical protein